MILATVLPSRIARSEDLVALGVSATKAGEADATGGYHRRLRPCPILLGGGSLARGPRARSFHVEGRKHTSRRRRCARATSLLQLFETATISLKTTTNKKPRRKNMKRIILVLAQRDANSAPRLRPQAQSGLCVGSGGRGAHVYPLHAVDHAPRAPPEHQDVSRPQNHPVRGR